MAYTPMELANAFVRTGELDDALEALNDQLTQHPCDDDARRLRASVYQRLGDERLAQALADLNTIDDKTADDLTHISIIQEKTGDIAGAIETMQSVLDRVPTQERLVERLVQLYIYEERYEEALKLVRAQARDWRWWQWEGDLLALTGNDAQTIARYGLAMAQIDALLAERPGDYLHAIKGRIALVRGCAYQRMGLLNPAREHFMLALELLKDESIHFNLALLDALEDKLDSASIHAQRAWDASTRVVHESMLITLEDDAFASLRKRLGWSSN